MKEKILIHTGFHKTGTTWLQREVFRIEFGFMNVFSHQEIDKIIVRPHNLSFNAKITTAYLSNFPNLKSDLFKVVSSEILSGNPFFGARDNTEIAWRLFSIFENYDSQILVVIREQMDMLVSIYMQYLLRGGNLTPKDFFREYTIPGYFYFDWRHYEYHRIIKLYQNIFGEKNVHVLTYEELKKNNNHFVSKIKNICDMSPEFKYIASRKTGKSYSEISAPFTRIVNHFRDGPVNRNPLLNLGVLGDYMYHGTGKIASTSLTRSLLRNFKPVSKYVREYFSGKYAESNIKLHDLIKNNKDLIGYEGITGKT
jgi:hypothetical protein